jgi:hypothetical protein
MLRAVWRVQSGRLDEAEADLEALGDRRVSPLLEPYAPREDIRAEIASRRSRGSNVTTTTRP